MNISNLKCFCTVVKEGTITKAAETLHLTQQAVSSQISRLESSYNAKFFERNPKLRLTYAGECFYEYALDALDKEEHLLATLENATQQQSGRLIIGTNSTRACVLFPQILPDFMKEYPNIKVVLHIDNYTNLQKRLLDGEFDLVICPYLPSIPEGVTTVDIMNDDLCLVVSRSLICKLDPLADELLKTDITLPQITEHLKKTNLLAKLPFIVNKPHTYPRILKVLEPFSVIPNVVLELNNAEMLYIPLLAGIGATFVGKTIIDFFLPMLPKNADGTAPLVVLPVPDPNPQPRIVACYNSKLHLNWTARTFIVALQKRFQSN